MIEKTYTIHLDAPTIAEWIWNYRVKEVLQDHIEKYVEEEYPVVPGRMGYPIRLFTSREYEGSMFILPKKIRIDSDNNAVIRVSCHFYMMKGPYTKFSDSKTIGEVLEEAVDDFFANFSQYIDRLDPERLLHMEVSSMNMTDPVQF